MRKKQIKKFLGYSMCSVKSINIMDIEKKTKPTTN